MNTHLNPAGWIRLVIYILAALTGLAAVIINALGYSDLGVLVGTIAGAGATITGGTAVVNLPKANDQHPTQGFEMGKAIPAIMDIAAAARTYQQAMNYEPQHAAPQDTTTHPPTTSPMADYAATIRGE